jgi:hypothetical protein
MDQDSFHACATCIYYLVEKKNSQITYKCSRLGYETKPTHKFNCWTPKEKVIKLMKKRGLLKEGDSDVSSSSN